MRIARVSMEAKMFQEEQDIRYVMMLLRRLRELPVRKTIQHSVVESVRSLIAHNVISYGQPLQKLERESML
jgi:hypothetical protein